MPSDKTKVKDSLSNVGNLKEQLNSVFKQIKLFQSRIDEMKSSYREEDFGYMRSFDLEIRRNMLQSSHKSGKDPSKAAVFLIRTIVDSLCNGPLSEKDIKTVVMDKCQELGIKSTNRGTIAGLNLDVNTVCSVLAGVGLLEATTPLEAAADSASQDVNNHKTNTANEFGVKMCDSITLRWEADIARYLAEFKRPDPIPVVNDGHQSLDAAANSLSFKSDVIPNYYAHSAGMDTTFDADHDLSLLQSFDHGVDHSLLDVTSGSISHMDDTDRSFSEQLLNMASPPPQDLANRGYFPRHSLLQDEDSNSADIFASLASPLLSGPSTAVKRHDGDQKEIENDLMASLREYMTEEGQESSFVLDMLADSPLQQHQRLKDTSMNGDRERTLSEDSIQMARDLLLADTDIAVDGNEMDLERTTPAASSPADHHHEEGLSAALNDSDLLDSLLLMPSSPSTTSHHTHPLREENANDNRNNAGSPFFKSETASVSMMGDEESVCVSVQSSVKAGQTKGVRGGGSKTKPAGSGRRSAAVTRVWRIRADLSDQLRLFVESSTEGMHFTHVLLQPAAVLDQWSTASSDAAAASEVEEALMRRLATQCGFTLSAAPYRLGTRYLDPTYQELLPVEVVQGCAEPPLNISSAGGSGGFAGTALERQVSGDSVLSGRSRSGSNSSSAGYVNPSTPLSAQALYDEEVQITGSFLLDKVRRSKRQRGACLMSNGSTTPIFNSSYLNTLNTICGNTTSGYWDDTLKYAVNVLPLSMGFGNMPSSSSSSKANNAVLNAKNKIGKGGLDVSAPAGLHYPKHYSHPSPLVPDRVDTPLVKPLPPSSSSSGGDGTQPKIPLILAAIHLSDLSVYSQEIPWSTVASEFTVLGGEEAGAVFRDTHDQSSSTITPSGVTGGGALQRTISKDAGSSSSGTGGGHPNQYTKKKALAALSAASGGGSAVLPLVRSESVVSVAPTSSAAPVAKKPLHLQLPTYDVAAPTFREVLPPLRVKSVNQQTEVAEDVEEEEEEDISDEAVLARHNAVLRAMREKWALLQALKSEHSRRGSGGDYISNKKSGASGGGDDGSIPPVHYSGSGSHMKYKKYLSDSGEAGGGSDGKKRGHSMVSGNLKRRGRPPKMTKTMHAGGAVGALSVYPHYVSQRGNNQYTAIRAAAAHAANLALQQQQLSDAVTSGSDVSSTGSIVSGGIAAVEEVTQSTTTAKTAPSPPRQPSYHMQSVDDVSDLVDEPDDEQIEAALSMLLDSSDAETDDERGRNEGC